MIKRRHFIASTLATAAAASLSSGCSTQSTSSRGTAGKARLFDTHAHFYANEPVKYPMNATGARYGAERMLANFGASVTVTPEGESRRTIEVAGLPRLRPQRLEIPGDPSLAALAEAAAQLRTLQQLKNRAGRG